MSLCEFYGGFAMAILMDVVMGCRYGDFMHVFCRFHTSFILVLYGFMMVLWGLRLGLRRPPHPPLPSHHVKAKPTLMLLTECKVRKTCYRYLRCFLGLEGPVLSSFTENGPK